MAKHGLKSASKRARALATAEDEAEEALAFQDRRTTVAEERVDPAALRGKHKYRQDKEARMATVLEGARAKGALAYSGLLACVSELLCLAGL